MELVVKRAVVDMEAKFSSMRTWPRILLSSASSKSLIVSACRESSVERNFIDVADSACESTEERGGEVWFCEKSDLRSDCAGVIGCLCISSMPVLKDSFSLVPSDGEFVMLNSLLLTEGARPLLMLLF